MTRFLNSDKGNPGDHTSAVTMARCLGEELPENALYLDDDITLETAKALSR